MMKLKGSDLCHIIKDANYDANLQEISKGHVHRFVQLDSAIDWEMVRISKNPEIFDEVRPGYYLHKFIKLDDFPQVRILFEYNSTTHTVTLLSMSEIV